MTLRSRWRPGDRFLIRHRDPALLVVEKKAGLLTVPTRADRGDDLIALLEEVVGRPSRRKVLFAVHRLDRPVSGLLVVARRADAWKGLVAQFAAHDVERRYIAAVAGVLPDEGGTFESFLRSQPGSLRMYSDPGDEGRHAVTHWHVIERYPKADATLVEVWLETGLRNQIRVHFSEAGFPLLGEQKYLDREDEDASAKQGTRRIFLHAAVLGFVHPLTGLPMRFEAPLPPDLAAWKRKLESGNQGRPSPHSPAPRSGEAPRTRSAPRRTRPKLRWKRKKK